MGRTSQQYGVLERYSDLPAFPTIVTALLDACEDADRSIADIAAIIEDDPILSLKVLQLVNSSCYGPHVSFPGIEQAVMYLGVGTIRDIAVETTVNQVFNRTCYNGFKRFNLSTFWSQSLICAKLAKRLSLAAGFTNVDEAYLAGLLCNIGRLVLVSAFPREHEAILAETKDIRNEWWAENLLVGLNHCEAGARIVEKWNIKSLMADAIRYHHQPLDQIKASFPLVQIVYVANLLSEDGLDLEAAAQVSEVLFEVDHHTLAEMCAASDAEVRATAQKYDLTVPSLPVGAKHTDSIDMSSGDTLNSKSEESEVNSLPGQRILETKTRDLALLSIFLENLVLAEDSESIIGAYERAMSTLFLIDKVLLFFLDEDRVHLRARVSAFNRMQQLSQGLFLNTGKSDSLIVRTFLSGSPTYMTPTDAISKNGADHQIRNIFEANTSFLLPFSHEQQPLGIAMLGLPGLASTLAPADLTLIKTITRNFGSRLHLERMRE